ncbi:hypothetical protein ACEQ8H_004515 [Pleosporales sp. CAS-2024a]
MAGYGNRTAPDYVADDMDMTDQHSDTRLGLYHSSDPYSNAHPKYGSGATAGPGFGNKSDKSSSGHGRRYTSHDDQDKDEEGFRFAVHDEEEDTAAYRGASEARAGSGSTGGAGYGNKMTGGGFGLDRDSTVAKVMEKAGNLMHNEGLVTKGAAKREANMGEVEPREEPPFAN